MFYSRGVYLCEYGRSCKFSTYLIIISQLTLRGSLVGWLLDNTAALSLDSWLSCRCELLPITLLLFIFATLHYTKLFVPFDLIGCVCVICWAVLSLLTFYIIDNDIEDYDTSRQGSDEVEGTEVQSAFSPKVFTSRLIPRVNSGPFAKYMRCVFNASTVESTNNAI